MQQVYRHKYFRNLDFGICLIIENYYVHRKIYNNENIRN